MPVLGGNVKALMRKVNFTAVAAALLCLVAVVLVLVDRTLWTTSLVLIGAGAVLAYQGKEDA